MDEAVQARSTKGNAGTCAVRSCLFAEVLGAAWSAFPFFLGAGEMIPEDHIKLICQYEWLRMLADDLDVMSIAIDQCLADLEHRLPDYYQYSGDVRPKKE